MNDVEKITKELLNTSEDLKNSERSNFSDGTCDGGPKGVKQLTKIVKFVFNEY